MKPPKVNSRLLIPFICAFSFVICPKNSNSQTGNIITDAFSLKKTIDDLNTSLNTQNSSHVRKNVSDILSIINANKPSPPPYTSYKEMKADAEITNNNFLKNLLPGIPDSILNGLGNLSMATSTYNNIVPEGNLIGSMAIDALGTFIADRFKQEIEIAFLQKFKGWLQEEKFLQEV